MYIPDLKELAKIGNSPKGVSCHIQSTALQTMQSKSNGAAWHNVVELSTLRKFNHESKSNNNAHSNIRCQAAKLAVSQCIGLQ